MHENIFRDNLDESEQRKLADDLVNRLVEAFRTTEFVLPEPIEQEKEEKE